MARYTDSSLPPHDLCEGNKELFFMSKIHIEQHGDITAANVTRSPFAYRRPGSAVRHLIQRLTGRYVARIAGQALLSGSLIAGGITYGLNPIGAALGFTGLCLAFVTKDDQTPEEYRLEVIAHFAERGKTPPKWTIGGAK